VDIRGTTRLIALFGSPVTHSKSPAMLNAALAATRQDFLYVAFDVGVKQCAAAIQALRTLNARGANVTMPLKQAVTGLVDRLTPIAELAGAVNTIVNDEGWLTGHNTDGEGYFRALREAGVPFVESTMTIIGAGGAAAAITVQAAAEGVRRISIFNVGDDFFPAAERLAAGIRERYGCDARVGDLADAEELRRAIAEADILVNATPVGMAPSTDESVIADARYLHPALVVTDVVYAPVETRLLKQATSRGCRTVNGLGMVLFQAASAFKLWTGEEMPVDVARSAARRDSGPTT
jgi:shikimate dehydrogenase